MTKIVPRRGFWPSLDRPYTPTRKFHQQIRERLPHGPKQRAQITTKLPRTAKNPASPHSTRVSKNIEVRRCRVSVLNNIMEPFRFLMRTVHSGTHFHPYWGKVSYALQGPRHFPNPESRPMRLCREGQNTCLE